MCLHSMLLKAGRIRSLSIKEINGICAVLAEKASALNPEVVISIESGGLYIGKVVASKLKVPHYSFAVRRPKRELPKYTQWLQLFFTLWEVWKFRKRSPVLVSGLSVRAERELADKSIVLIDDAIDTGQTIEVAKAHLFSLGVSQIAVIVVGNVQGKQVDYSHLDGRYCYPWSRLSREYKIFQEYLART